MYEVEYKNISSKTAKMVEEEYIDFIQEKIPVSSGTQIKFGAWPKSINVNLNPETRENDAGLCINKKCFSWNAIEKKWKREVKVKEPPPKFIDFLTYGAFRYSKNKKDGLNAIVIRVPGSGVNWHKEIIPAIRSAIKTLCKIPDHKKCPYFNFDGDYKECWKTKIYYRYLYKNGKLIKQK